MGEKENLWKRLCTRLSKSLLLAHNRTMVILEVTNGVMKRPTKLTIIFEAFLHVRLYICVHVSTLWLCVVGVCVS